VDFGGSWLLPRLVGMHRAKELVLLAEIIDAREAERIGLVNRVVPHDRLLDETRALAARLANLPPLALALSKRLLDDAPSMSMAQAVASENAAQALVATSRDTAEAVLAFLEGREPNYTGT
jgi:enoyl-CoA hydratase/carnithine racemase